MEDQIDEWDPFVSAKGLIANFVRSWTKNNQEDRALLSFSPMALLSFSQMALLGFSPMALLSFSQMALLSFSQMALLRFSPLALLSFCREDSQTQHNDFCIKRLLVDTGMHRNSKLREIPANKNFKPHNANK